MLSSVLHLVQCLQTVSVPEYYLGISLSKESDRPRILFKCNESWTCSSKNRLKGWKHLKNHNFHLFGFWVISCTLWELCSFGNMVGIRDLSVSQNVLMPWFVTLQYEPNQNKARRGMFGRDNYYVIQFSFVLHYVYLFDNFACPWYVSFFLCCHR